MLHVDADWAIYEVEEGSLQVARQAKATLCY